MIPITWKTYLECQCSSKAHLFVLEYDEDLGLSISQQAFQWQGFFKRCLQAFKYVFGHGQGQLCWDTALVRPEDIPKVREWLSKIDGQVQVRPAPLKMPNPSQGQD